MRRAARAVAAILLAMPPLARAAAPAPAICPSGLCASPLATLAPPNTRCQTVSADLTCAQPPTYQVGLGSGQTFTFTLCSATCPTANAAFDSSLTLSYLGVPVATSDNTCGDDAEIVYNVPVGSAGNYCLTINPQVGMGMYELGYFVACEAPLSVSLTPAQGGTTEAGCAHPQTFTVNTTGTGPFTFDWVITPTGGNTAVPSTRTMFTNLSSDQLTSTLTGAGVYQVEVTVRNDCGQLVERVDFDLQDRAGPDLVCTANQVSCLRGQASRGGRTASGGAPAGDGGPVVAPGTGTGSSRAAIAESLAENGEEVRAILLGAPTPEEAERRLREKLALLPGQVRVYDSREPRFQRPPGGEALSCPTPCNTGTLQATHPYYDVFVNCDDGAYTARTGASHSVTALAGGPQNVIFGGAGGNPATSDLTFFIHNNSTEIMNPLGGSACAFDPPDTGSEPNSTGLEVEWAFDPVVAGLLPLTLREEVVAFGATEADSGVRLTLGIANPAGSTATAQVGFKWQIDYQNATDDGPGFAAAKCDPFELQPELFSEYEFSPAEILDFYRIQNNSGSPIFANFTSTSRLAGFPDTEKPDRLLYGTWPNMRGSNWNYAPAIGANADFDSATLVYYGYAAPDALSAAPGEYVSRSVVIFTAANASSCGAFRPGTGTNARIDICDGTCVELGATAADNCTATPSVTLTQASAGAPACGANPCMVQFPTAGLYTYDWEATDQAGNATQCTTTVNVEPTPIADLAPIPEICDGTDVVLDASGPAPTACSQPLEYQFQSGVTILQPWSTANTYGPFQPPTSASYSVRVRCPGTGCQSGDSENQVVVPHPSVSVAQLPDICDGEPITIDASGTAANGCPVALEYQVRNGPLVLRPWSTNPIYGPISPRVPTTYTVDVRCTVSPGCLRSADATVVVSPVPTPEAGSDQSVCRDAPLQLDGSASRDPGCPGGILYEWRQGAVVLQPASPVATYNPPTGTLGISTYTLVVSCAGTPTCQESDDVVVVVRSCTLAVVFSGFEAAWVRPAGSPSLIEVRWGTVIEEETSFFEIERAESQGGPYLSIGAVDAHGPASPYRFEDRTAVPGSSPWYRVVEHTANGRGDQTPAFQTSGARKR